MQVNPLWLCAGLILGLTGPANCETVQIDFDELVTQPANGVSIRGVTFGFWMGNSPSDEATYNYPIGLDGLSYEDGGVLEGPAGGTLTMDFARPTPLLIFGAAFATLEPLEHAMTVNLLAGDGTLLEPQTLAAAPLAAVDETEFRYLGVPVRRAAVSFDEDACRFAIDRVTFETPEVGTMMLLGSGVLLLAAGRLRRRT
ncbi:MAG TPA: hypothetical protein VFA33_09650 [Bryobacteraceae bacterium]|nr:hypothetical protein [Bryobacteraceae bacterium]